MMENDGYEPSCAGRTENFAQFGQDSGERPGIFSVATLVRRSEGHDFVEHRGRDEDAGTIRATKDVRTCVVEFFRNEFRAASWARMFVRDVERDCLDNLDVTRDRGNVPVEPIDPNGKTFGANVDDRVGCGTIFHCAATKRAGGRHGSILLLAHRASFADAWLIARRP
jgi:hypothetical protein